MMAAADGMLVARAAAATRARGEHDAATPFLAREKIAGEVPSEGFVLDQRPPILRYAEVQDALLLVAREQEGAARARWISVQPAGAGIVLDGPTVSEQTRVVLRELWAAVHPEPGAEPDVAAAAKALLAALTLSEQKLRALAFLDLSTLANDPQHLPPLITERLLGYGGQPEDDAQMAPAVRDLGRRLTSRGTAGNAPPAATGAKQP